MQGDARVDVEYREGCDSYGQGLKKQMLFADFLQGMHAGDDSLYLTTQIVRSSHRKCMHSVQHVLGHPAGSLDATGCRVGTLTVPRSSVCWPKTKPESI